MEHTDERPTHTRTEQSSILATRCSLVWYYRVCWPAQARSGAPETVLNAVSGIS
jgi:hypothetical protein